MKNTDRRVAWFALLGVLAGGALSACSDATTSPAPDAGRDAVAWDFAGPQNDASPGQDAAADAGAPDTLAVIDVIASDLAPPDLDGALVVDGSGVANPASANCTDKGGSLDIRTGAGGQYGVCVFKDGSECEEWAFFRGQCQPGDCDIWESCKLDGGTVLDGGVLADGGAADGAATGGNDGGAADRNSGIANPASVNCTDKGGSLDIRTGAGGQYGVCVFKNGSECEEWAFYRGECEPGDCDIWETCKLDGGAVIDSGAVDGGAADGAATGGNDGRAAVDGGAGIANPASVNCTDKGGSWDLRNGTDGQYGVCVFKDGSECEEWALYRGQCSPGDCTQWETCVLTFDAGTTG